MGIRVLLCCFLLQNTDYKNSLLVLCQKIQAAQNYRKPQQNSCIQRQYPFAGHLLTPF